jgi:anti-repressor protein
MSYNLIPTLSGSLNGESQTLVNARELHQFLDVGTRFDKWIKNRISEYGFTQAIDFLECPNLANRGFWKTETNEFHLSLDMAKELCMVERSDKGRAARRYFIEMEKQAKSLGGSLTDNRTTAALQAEISRLGWQVQELQDEYCKTHPEALKLTRYYMAGLKQSEMALLLGTSRTTIRDRLRLLAAMGFIDYQSKCYNLPHKADTQQTLALEG